MDQGKGTTDYSNEHPLPSAVPKAILPSLKSLGDLDLLKISLYGST